MFESIVVYVAAAGLVVFLAGGLFTVIVGIASGLEEYGERITSTGGHAGQPILH